MRKFIFFMAALLMVAGSVAAQQDVPLSVSFETNRDAVKPVELRMEEHGEDLVLIATKNKPGIYTVYVKFDPPMTSRTVTIYDKQTEILRSKSIPLFLFSYCPGKINAKPEMDFVYRLPFAEGVSMTVNVRDSQDDHEKRNRMRFSNHTFFVSEDSDIYAIRKGEVIEVSPIDKNEASIVIEHEDGTRAMYQGVKSVTPNVAPGDIVYPDTTIGKASRLTINVVWHSAPVTKGVPDFNMISRTGIAPIFLTSEGPKQLVSGENYESTVTEELIVEEMTKREKRNRK